MIPDASVLIAGADPAVADRYATWLEDDWRVETARDRDEALETIDEGIDAVVFDRRTPELSGTTLLETVRDRDLDCGVVMVAGAEPDADVLERGFDDCLVGPVSRDDLRDVVELSTLRATYDRQLRELFALASEKARLERGRSDAELRTSREYAELEDRLAVLRVHVDDTMDELLARDGYRRLCRDVVCEPAPEN